MITQARIVALKEIEGYDEIPNHIRKLLISVMSKHFLALEESLGTIHLAYLRGRDTGRDKEIS